MRIIRIITIQPHYNMITNVLMLPIWSTTAPFVCHQASLMCTSTIHNTGENVDLALICAVM